MNYLDYLPEDFLADEYFQQWVLQPDAENQQFWENWLRQNPAKRPAVEQARQILQSLHLQTDSAFGADRERSLWERIQATKEHKEQADRQALTLQPGPVPLWRAYRKMAAAFIGLLLCGAVLLLMLRSPATVRHATAYGEIKKIVLPDQSTVILNGNSSLQYAAQWDGRGAREVQLEGEAFFSVTHTRNHQKFFVKTSPKLAIEVLGTQFNVRHRRGGLQVVLNNGKVKLLIDPGQERKKQVVMQPGDLVQLTQSATGYVKKQVNPAQFSSWTQQKLIFKNTSVGEIVTLLEETYGVTVEVPDTALLGQQITGSVPSNSLESILFVLKGSFNYDITREKDRIILSEKNTQ
jgi:ferric-dicitrate binding protein FerR (iron transport regulator)